MPSEKQLAHYAKMRAAKEAKRQADIAAAAKTAPKRKPPTAKQLAYWESMRNKPKTEKQAAYQASRKPGAAKYVPEKKTRDETKALQARRANLAKANAAKAAKKRAATKPARLNVGEEFTFADVLNGRLPDKYPYFVQTKPAVGSRRPTAKLITSDADVSRLLRSLETSDTRAKIVDIKKPKIVTPKSRAPVVSAEDDFSHLEQMLEEISRNPNIDKDLEELASMYAEEDPGRMMGPQELDREELEEDIEEQNRIEREAQFLDFDDDYMDADSPIGKGSGGSSAGYGCGGVGSVAKSRAENCLLNIIRMMDRDVNVVYEKFPHLRPNNTGKSIYITHSELECVSNLLKVNIIVYTAFGAKIDKPWHKFEYSNNRVLRVIFENGHAYLLKRKHDIDNIIYGPLPDIRDIEGLVVDHEYYGGDSCPEAICNEYNERIRGQQVPMYYTVLFKNKYTMLKSYRVSSLTGNAADDYCNKNLYIFNDAQYLFKRFKKRYDMKVIKQEDMREIVKSAEHFIGREIYDKILPTVKIIDQNKNYCAYKTCGYYIGFPGNELAASLHPQPEDSPYKDTFVVVDIKDYPWYFERMFKYTSGDICLPVPTYRYLVDNGAKCNVKYWIASLTKDIDIVNYANEVGPADEKEKKNFRNALIGRCISGGMKDKKGKIIPIGNVREREQILYECATEGATVTINEDGSLYVRYAYKPTAIYQFHAYILGYAAIHLMKKAKELVDNGCKIAGYNVDSLFYYGTHDGSRDPQTIGGWKYENIEHKKALFSMKPTTLNPYPERKLKAEPKHFDGFRYRKNTIIIGPPGVGKSREFRERPLISQIITTPTRLLREAFKEGELGFENTFTIHKYVQFSMDDAAVKARRKAGRIPPLHTSLIIDEFTMLTRGQFDTIMSRVVRKNTRVIVLGDPEQISNSVNGEPLTIAYMQEKYGFELTTVERKEDMVCRHEYNEGCILDKLRGLPLPKENKYWWENATARTQKQVERLKPHVKSVNNIYNQLGSMLRAEDNDIYVSDTHRKLHIVNAAARTYCVDNNLPFPVSDGKGNIIRISPDDHNIWWGRQKMLDVKPDNLKYEPAFAVTGDSIQGRTLECKVYVDTNIIRPNVFYTAVTRTRKLDSIILVKSHPLEVEVGGAGNKHPISNEIECKPIQCPQEPKEHASPAEGDIQGPLYNDETPVEEPKFSEGPKQGPKQYVDGWWDYRKRTRLLKKQVKMITKTFEKGTPNIETFAEFRCWQTCSEVCSTLRRCMTGENWTANRVGKHIRERFSELYKEINEQNKGTSWSTPTNLIVYKELYRLSLKCFRQKEYVLAMMYRSKGVYNLLLEIYEELRTIDPDTLKSVEHVKRVWNNIDSMLDVDVDEQQRIRDNSRSALDIIERTLGGKGELYACIPQLGLTDKRCNKEMEDSDAECIYKYEKRLRKYDEDIHKEERELADLERMPVRVYKSADEKQKCIRRKQKYISILIHNKQKHIERKQQYIKEIKEIKERELACKLSYKRRIYERISRYELKETQLLPDGNVESIKIHNNRSQIPPPPDWKPKWEYIPLPYMQVVHDWYFKLNLGNYSEGKKTNELEQSLMSI